MKLSIRRTKKKMDTPSLEPITRSIDENDNLGAQFDWLHILPEESMYTDPGGELTDKHVHLELRMLRPPKLVLGTEHPRAKLNLFVTKWEIIDGFEYHEKAEHPDHVVVIPRCTGHFGIAGMEEPLGYWPKQEDNEIPRFYLMVKRFHIRGAQIGYTYLVEGSLQIEGCDHTFKLPSFSISYDPRKAFPQLNVDKWTRSRRAKTKKSKLFKSKGFKAMRC